MQKVSELVFSALVVLAIFALSLVIPVNANYSESPRFTQMETSAGSAEGEVLGLNTGKTVDPVSGVVLAVGLGCAAIVLAALVAVVMAMLQQRSIQQLAVLPELDPMPASL